MESVVGSRAGTAGVNLAGAAAGSMELQRDCALMKQPGEA